MREADASKNSLHFKQVCAFTPFVFCFVTIKTVLVFNFLKACAVFVLCLLLRSMHSHLQQLLFRNHRVNA